MNISGTVVGYDPGGNSSHGVAIFSFDQGNLKRTSIYTYQTANEVIEKISMIDDVISIGIDTLTCWSTGKSGWRPADRWLKKRYKKITNSIASANSLFGSMGLNGMSVLISLREIMPDLYISETHPKVLYYALSKQKYDYLKNRESMDGFLSNLFNVKIETRNAHEWDAAISVYAVLKGYTSQWVNDLHQLPHSADERLVTPCGNTCYWWPEE